MLPEVKKKADKGDIRGLRYIFGDCLDVDPTFVKYQEDWDYCLNIEGFLDEYEEHSPLITDPSCWDEDYWVMLKSELMENFSQKRFEHMKEVAKVYYAEKVKRLEAERMEKENAAIKNPVTSPLTDAPKPVDNTKHETPDVTITQNVSITPDNESAAAHQRLEEEKAEQYRREQAERDAQFEAEQKKRQAERERKMKEEERKKLMGAAAIAIAVLVIAVVVILLIK